MSLLILVVILGLLFLEGSRGLVYADDSSTVPVTEETAPATDTTIQTTPDPQINPDTTSDNTSTSENSTTPVVDSSSLPSDSESSSSSFTLNLATTSPSSTADIADLNLPSSTLPESGSGTTIQTGDAVGVANIVNVINTNIFDAQGFLYLLNLFFPVNGNVDFQNLSFPFSDCTNCQLSLVGNTNVGEVNNNVSVTSNTGANSISSSTNGTIVTGSSVAAANVVNIVNSNIVGSNYLLLVLNNFSSWIGDLVFPGDDFFGHMTGGSSDSGSGDGSVSSTIENNNEAAINNNLDSTADTGSNEVSGSGSSTITTGDAVAAANSLTVANQNIVGNTQVIVVVRVFGTWTGNVLSTPPGISWTETPSGIVLYNADNALGSGPCCMPSGQVTNNNSSTVNNNVRAIALTGNNKIENGGSGSISTGNAVAVANVMNLVNTNIVGHNILLAMINIFGDWQGNITFGRPDLWVGLQAQLPANPVPPGTEVTYHLSVVNRGTATATNVEVKAKNVLRKFMTITDAGGGTIVDDGIVWNIPSLRPGGTMTFTFKTTLGAAVFGQETMGATATSLEGDADAADNTDSISYAIEAPMAGSGEGDPYSALWIKESNSANAPIDPDTSVDFKIMISNDGGMPAGNLFLFNVLYSPYGDVVSSSSWSLGTLNPRRQVMVKYTTEFMENASSGYYMSYSWLQDGSDKLSNLVTSSTIYLVNPNDPTTAPPPPHIFVIPDVQPDFNKTSTIGVVEEQAATPRILSHRPPRPTIAKAPAKPIPPEIKLPPIASGHQTLTSGSRINGLSNLASVSLSSSFDWFMKTVISPFGKTISNRFHR